MLSKVISIHKCKTLIAFILENTNFSNFTNRRLVNTIVNFANRIRTEGRASQLHEYRPDGKIRAIRFD